MTDINISSVPVGIPALGRCSGLEKLGTANARDRAPEVKRPDNVTAGRHCQTPACVLARPKGRAKANWWKKPFQFANDTKPGGHGSSTATSPLCFVEARSARGYLARARWPARGAERPPVG